VNGGFEPYTYEWYDSTGTLIGIDTLIDSLAPGIYWIVITDSMFCSDSAYAIVVAPAGFGTKITDTTDVSCYGGNDGSATVIVDPAGLYTGTGPISWSWNGSPPQINDSTATGLTAGIYEVIITDSINCQTGAVITINQPDSITISISKTDVSCFGDGDGAAAATVTGGTSPFTFFWTPGNFTTDSIGGLNPGLYNVSITDANGCTASVTDTIIQPAALAATFSKNDITCYGFNNGTATVITSDGTPPYTYLWSDGQTNNTAASLSPVSFM